MAVVLILFLHFSEFLTADAIWPELDLENYFFILKGIWQRQSELVWLLLSDDNAAASREGSSQTPAHEYSDFRFRTYAPVAFRYFRELFGIQPDDFLVSWLGYTASH